MSIGMIDWVGLRTNVLKMVDMVFQPGPIARLKSSAAYGWQINSKGDPHHLSQIQRVVCGDCEAELAT